jgi:hypothetical protein
LAYEVFGKNSKKMQGGDKALKTGDKAKEASGEKAKKATPDNDGMDGKGITASDYKAKTDPKASETKPPEKIYTHSLNSTWYKSLIAIPAYFKNTIIGVNETEQCNSFLGRYSKFNYTCDPTDRYYVFYINMTISNEIAQDLQQRYSINEIIDFRVMSYSQAFERLYKDGFFTEKLQDIKMDFITYDRFYDLHGLTKIDIKRNEFGEIYHNVRTDSIRLN